MGNPENYCYWKGCYVSKLQGVTSHRAVVVSNQVPLLPSWGPHVFAQGEYSWVNFLAVESTKLETKVQIKNRLRNCNI